MYIISFNPPTQKSHNVDVIIISNSPKKKSLERGHKSYPK